MDLSIRSSISVTDRAAATKSPGYSFRTASGGCSREAISAGVPGLEPRMAEPESAVLPITPYPNDLGFRFVAGCGGTVVPAEKESTKLFGGNYKSPGQHAVVGFVRMGFGRPLGPAAGTAADPASAVRAGNPWRMRRCRSARDPKPVACGLRFARHRHRGRGARSRSNSGNRPSPTYPTADAASGDGVVAQVPWWRGGAARQCHWQRGSGAGSGRAPGRPTFPALADRRAAPLGPARRSRGPPGGVIRWARPIRVRPAGGAWILPARAVPWIRTAAG